MKKQYFLFAIPLAIFALAVVFVAPSDTNAQNYSVPVACPAGYICEPIQCPAGFICRSTDSIPSCPDGYRCTRISTIPVPVACPAGYICEPIKCPAGFTCEPTATVPGCPKGYSCRLSGTVPPSTGSAGSSAGPACYQFNNNLTIGNTGGDVVALQILLESKGFNIPEISSGNATSGYFGQSTANAVRLYQRSMGISDTGFVGPLTRASLNSSCWATVPQSQPSITVLSPNGGETLQIGKTYDITWKSQGIEQIYISLVTTNGGYEREIQRIANGISTMSGLTGHHTWQVPSNLTTENLNGSVWKIKIVNYNGSIGSGVAYDYSDNYFSITSTPGTTPQPSITNITPAQGSANTTVTIYGTNLLGATSVEFYKNGQLAGSLAPSYVASNYLTFTVSGIFAANVLPGDYQISVVTNKCAGGCNSNRIGFTLASQTTTQPSITVLSPNGGETLQIGKTYDITWRSQGVEQIYISLVTMNGGYEREIQRIANGISTMSGLTGHYNWQVPSNLTTENLNGSVWKIKIVNYNGSIGSGVAYDYSDNYFSITSGTTSITPVSVNGSCGTALNSCQTGTFRDVTDNGGYRYWSCLGSNGGTDRLCTYNVPSTSPVNGSCGTALNSCQTGTFSDVTDNGGYSYWNCLGSNGGTNRLCTYQPNATF